MIEVLQPGLLSTVQDLGRYGHAHDGVSPAGACDPLSLRIGNLLVGNPANTAALELTITGGAFQFHSDALVALTGAPLDHPPAPPWTSFLVKAGEVLQAGAITSGCRAYLCVSGGIAVEGLMGSSSTHLPSGLGGFHGRALARGDALRIGSAPGDLPPPRRVPSRFQSLLQRRTRIRVTAGPHLDRCSPQAVFRFFSSSFAVRPASNRQGLRLEGPALPYPGEIVSEGVPAGAVQLLPGGQPLLLFVDAQTTGGYPVIACAASVDLPSVGQIRPGDTINFTPISLDEALSSLRAQEDLLRQLAGNLGCCA